MKQYLMKMKGGESPSLEELNQLNAEVESFSLASHMFWSLWAIVNAAKSQIPFGYWVSIPFLFKIVLIPCCDQNLIVYVFFQDYALSRIEWYYRTKQDIIKNDNGASSLKRKIREVDIWAKFPGKSLNESLGKPGYNSWIMWWVVIFVSMKAIKNFYCWILYSDIFYLLF